MFVKIIIIKNIMDLKNALFYQFGKDENLIAVKSD